MIPSLIARELGRHPDDATPDATLASLGADWLDCCVVALAIEDELGLRLPCEVDFGPEHTVGEVAAMVEAVVAGRNEMEEL